MSFCAGLSWRGKPGQQPGLQGHRDRRLASMYTKLAAGIVDMEIDGAFRQAQNNTHFPTGLADRCPLQATQFPVCECERFHGHVLLRSIPLSFIYIY